MIKGFKNFLMRGDVVVVAIGLMVALGFSTLIKAFTDSIINPILNRFQGRASIGLGVQLGQKGNPKTFLDIGAFLSALLYFAVFMAVLYFLIVVPYRAIMARRGQTVFGEPAPVKTCPACCSDDLPAAATRCKYCGSEQPRVADDRADQGGDVSVGSDKRAGGPGEQGRISAQKTRERAQVIQLEADRTTAAADERAARAQQERLAAEQERQAAERHLSNARDLRARADELDPDTVDHDRGR